MNYLKKLSISLVAVAGVAMVASGMFSVPAASALPSLAELTSRTDARIATDLSDELQAAKQLPRMAQSIRTASVQVMEMSGVVVVKATRLPLVEHFAGAGVVSSNGIIGL